MTIGLLTQSLVMTTMPLSVRTSTIESILHLRESTWHVVTLITVRLVCNVMVLANVDGSLVVPAVVPVITQRLHVDLCTLLDIVVSEGATTRGGFHQLECVASCRHTVL